MDVFKHISTILFPLILIGSLAVFIIVQLYMNYKKRQKILRGFFVPYGMLAGAIIGVLISLFIKDLLVYIVTLSSGIGMLIGYFVEEKVNQIEKNNF